MKEVDEVTQSEAKEILGAQMKLLAEVSKVTSDYGALVGITKAMVLIKQNL